MIYKLYRSPAKLSQKIRSHELIAVEHGKNIYDAADRLLNAVTEDMAESPEYAGYTATADGPYPINTKSRIKRYAYEIWGIAMPKYGDKNLIRDYGVVETSEP